MGLVGSEGMLGVSLLLGVNVAPFWAIVQGAASCLRLDAAQFSHELRRSLGLDEELNRYLHVLVSQLAPMGACTHFDDGGGAARALAIDDSRSGAFG